MLDLGILFTVVILIGCALIPDADTRAKIRLAKSVERKAALAHAQHMLDLQKQEVPLA